MSQNDRKLAKTDEEWKAILTPLQFSVTQKGATERPFTGLYTDHKELGVYHCVCCDTPLFHAQGKFHSGCGWPSFFEPIDKVCVAEREDISHGMRRVEVVCTSCDAHLGHVFEDGPKPTGLRYCINSVALTFKKTT